MDDWYEISIGDTSLRLGDRFGLAPDTIWKHPNNEGLRKLRKDMNELVRGDQLFIPPVRKREETRAVDARHVFRRRGVPARYRLQVLHHGKPVADTHYILVVDDKTFEGSTDGGGVVDQVVPPSAERGLLVVYPEGDRPCILVRIKFGYLDPVNTARGLRKRLRNLGFWKQADPDNERAVLALLRFQKSVGLPATGMPDSKTIQALESLHDSPSFWKTKYQEGHAPAPVNPS